MGLEVAQVVIGILVLFVIGFLVTLIKCYRKVLQGQALIRNGVGGTQVSFSGKFVIPILHRCEYMDVSVKRIEIDRRAQQGLICKDNLRADIVVAFFVRVNNTVEDVIQVAQSLGCKRASDQAALVELFDAKFSEALKTVGKQFDFSELYTNRMSFREQILQIIGTDLSGYVLEDAAIDYLEQTDKQLLNPDNILDAEGIKKIAVLDTLLGNRYLDINSIVFMDEPESALHPGAVFKFLEIVGILASRGIQFFMASHSYFVVKKLFLMAQKDNIPIPVISVNDGQWTSADLRAGMPENTIIDESIRLYREEVDLVFK